MSKGVKKSLLPKLTPREKNMINNVLEGLREREKDLTFGEVVTLCSILTQFPESCIYRIIESKKEEMDLECIKTEPSEDLPVETFEFVIKEFDTVKDDLLMLTPTVYVCNKCGYTATKSGYLKIHMRRHVKDLQQVLKKCQLCNYKSKHTHVVRRHFSIVHNKGELFKCNKCGYVALSKIELLRHERIHSGKQLFKCRNCEYQTNNKYHLKKHHRMHSKTMRFECNLCDFKTASKEKLRDHKMLHSEKYKCAICDANYTHKRSLNFHIRFKHKHDEKPTEYNCDRCNFTTFQKTKFIWHVRTHSGKSLFECISCEYKTNRKSNLKQHFKIHSQLS